MLTIILFLFILILIFGGTILLYFLINLDIDYIAYILSVLMICFFSIMRLAEHLLALPKSCSTQINKIETFTVIIPAYLPAEQYIIVDTIKYFLSLNLDLEIILPYNTPQPLPVEAELKKMSIFAVKVPNSKSKAENLNYVLDKIKTKYTAIFDADHRPIETNFTKALYKLKMDYDIVQGSCFPLMNSPMSMLLNIEFNQIYNFIIKLDKGCGILRFLVVLMVILKLKS